MPLNPSRAARLNGAEVWEIAEPGTDPAPAIELVKQRRNDMMRNLIEGPYGDLVFVPDDGAATSETEFPRRIVSAPGYALLSVGDTGGSSLRQDHWEGALAMVLR